MRRCAEQVLDTLRQTGPILTYSPFERRVFNVLIKRFPDLKAPLEALTERIVDLLPFVKKHDYDPTMRGPSRLRPCCRRWHCTCLMTDAAM